MSETPVPETRMDAAGAEASASDSWQRKKTGASPGRPVSAFASVPPIAAQLGAGMTPESDATNLAAFVAAVRAAGMMRELGDAELEHHQAKTADADGAVARRLDLLDRYYEAEGDAVRSLRRRATDRWVLHRAGDRISAAQLLSRLLSVLPELSGTNLERVGSSSGTLVLRLGEHVCALDDDADDNGAQSVSVHEMVRALNVLLDRKGIRARLVGLLGDGQREGYIGLPSLTAAVGLLEADYLTPTDVETLMALTGW